VKVTLLFFDGCPNWQVTEASLATLADELGFELERFRLESEDDAQRWYFRGSPTVLIDGRDAFATGDEPFGLSCRVYGPIVVSPARRPSISCAMSSPRRTRSRSTALSQSAGRDTGVWLIAASRRRAIPNDEGCHLRCRRTSNRTHTHPQDADAAGSKVTIEPI
jgi:hypothetical protein